MNDMARAATFCLPSALGRGCSAGSRPHSIAHRCRRPRSSATRWPGPHGLFILTSARIGRGRLVRRPLEHYQTALCSPALSAGGGGRRQCRIARSVAGQRRISRGVHWARVIRRAAGRTPGRRANGRIRTRSCHSSRSRSPGRCPHGRRAGSSSSASPGGSSGLSQRDGA